jgi:hypothetical protein
MDKQAKSKAFLKYWKRENKRIYEAYQLIDCM